MRGHLLGVTEVTEVGGCLTRSSELLPALGPHLDKPPGTGGCKAPRASGPWRQSHAAPSGQGGRRRPQAWALMVPLPAAGEPHGSDEIIASLRLSPLLQTHE